MSSSRGLGVGGFEVNDVAEALVEVNEVAEVAEVAEAIGVIEVGLLEDLLEFPFAVERQPVGADELWRGCSGRGSSSTWRTGAG